MIYKFEIYFGDRNVFKIVSGAFKITSSKGLVRWSKKRM